MEVFTGDRRMPTDVVFYPTDNLTHFPSSPSDTHQHRPNNPPPPPQKLRPIRCNDNLTSFFQQQEPTNMSCYHPLEEEEDSGGFLLTQEEEEEEDKQTSADAEEGAVLVGSCALPENVLENTSSLVVGAAESLKLLAQTQQQFQFGVLSSCADDADETPEAIQEPSNRKRKRTREKLETFMETMMKNVMQKQEQFHRQMIMLLETRENERIIREEAWKQQEIERAERERQERAQKTSCNLALISFIQNLMGQEIHIPTPLQTPSREKERDKERGGIQNQEEFKCDPSNNQEEVKYDPGNNHEDLKFGSGNNQEELLCDPNNRRWPESEVQALITVRASLCNKFNAKGSKNSIWEEVAVGMVKYGYSRTAKKCKEKWDNINKYYKRLAENGTKRSNTSSKVCPYFYELDMMYKSGSMVLGRGNNDLSKKDMEEQSVEK